MAVSRGAWAGRDPVKYDGDYSSVFSSWAWHGDEYSCFRVDVIISGFSILISLIFHNLVTAMVNWLRAGKQSVP